MNVQEEVWAEGGAWFIDLNSRRDTDTCIISLENKWQHLEEAASLFFSHAELEQTRYSGDGLREV